MRNPTLRHLGEDRVVALLTKNLPLGPTVIAGAGDDCAVLASPHRYHWQLLKTDVVVEHVHFPPQAPAAAVGWKAACRALSDIAAMGGWPTHAVVSVVAPPETPVAWLRGVYRGLVRAARRFSFSIVGGESSGSPAGSPIVLNVALLGEVEAGCCLRRAGARPADVLCVTGRLGGSLASGRHLKFAPRLSEARWLVSHFRPTAMIDLSDGLAKDLPRLAKMSGVGWSLDLPAIPRHRGCSLAQALGDGEDFELLFTVSARRRLALELAWKREFPRLPLTVIGRTAEAGKHEPPLRGGFEHFGAATVKKIPNPKSETNSKL
jgi:thiamine-monophosphate kinase